MSHLPTPPTGDRIRVLRIIARMNVGGPAVQISTLLRGLDQSQFEQKLITGYCEANEIEIDYLETSSQEISLERIKRLGRSISLFSDLIALFQITKIIRNFKPHIVHTHTAKAGLIGRIASICSGHKSKRIHTFHGHLLSGYFSKNKTKIYIFIEKCLSLITHNLICVGGTVRDDLIMAGIGKYDQFRVVPPGVQTPAIFDRHRAATQLNVEPSRTYCLFLGRITMIKRPDRLLEVVSILKSKKIDVTFIVAGGGELLNETKRISDDLQLPVVFLGWQHDLDALFSVTDILVMTSDNEGTPLSIIQAQLAGVPVVSTDVGSTHEVLLNGESGFLTNYEPQKIAQKIELLVSNPKMRLKMGAKGKNFALDNFSPERLVTDHEDIYKKILTGLTNF
jgi:glycosyltransferase involved in cell wall biosynthesis